MSLVQHPAEYEDPNPGKGAIPPRAWNVDSDSQKQSLNGDWRFRFSPIASVPEEFGVSTKYDDKSWDKIAVPSHWVLKGYGAPAYQNVKFPFPVDPPRVPTQNPTGDYRTEFRLPSDWLKSGKVSFFLCAVS